ncbi:hypothetical protein F4777DRAFT_435827 [Nemania sp. FL0916]|nr:hypothetical protein F4777DRAFT_435827 [Nemania sp. FL0916]
MKMSILTANMTKSVKIPKRNDERIILHFDYDCFYASVFENAAPALKSQPLGVQQKSILATCNYVARARGVRKLMLVSEAQRICPDLVLVNGEDLTRFRTVSKTLWAFLRAHSWNRRVERLGLDEVFLDVTDVVAYNQALLNPHALSASFFQLDRTDPERGFAFDGSRFQGPVRAFAAQAVGDNGVNGDGDDGVVELDVEDPSAVRLMLASHLAGYLRHKLDTDFGYTSSGGISTNKLLAKLAGNVHKPNNQTTLLTTSRDGDAAVANFMDAHSIRKVPGIGSRMAQLIEEHILSRTTTLRDREATNATVGEVRQYPGMSAEMLEQILSRPGAERGSGERVWGLLHGVDPSEVKEASDVPTQISVEDTYMSRPLQTPAEVVRELRALAVALLRRMRVDLTEADIHASTSTSTTNGNQKDVAAAAIATAPTVDSASSPLPLRWLAHPKTLRLSTRTKPKPTQSNNSSSSSAATSEMPSFSRSSRSAPLPNFVFHPISVSHSPPTTSALGSSSTRPPSPSAAIEDLAARLVTECLLPLFRRLHPTRGGWNLALLNVCATNMVMAAAGDSGSGMSGGAAPGRDIGRMFRTQEDKLREWTVYDDDNTSPSPGLDLTLAPVPDSAPPPRVFTAGAVVDRDVVMEEDDDDEEKDRGILRFGGEPAAEGSSSPLLDDGDGDDATWEDEESDTQRCQICGHAIPSFAIAAHERFHAMAE